MIALCCKCEVRATIPMSVEAYNMFMNGHNTPPEQSGPMFLKVRLGDHNFIELVHRDASIGAFAQAIITHAKDLYPEETRVLPPYVTIWFEGYQLDYKYKVYHILKQGDLVVALPSDVHPQPETQKPASIVVPSSSSSETEDVTMESKTPLVSSKQPSKAAAKQTPKAAASTGASKHTPRASVSSSPASKETPQATFDPSSSNATKRKVAEMITPAHNAAEIKQKKQKVTPPSAMDFKEQPADSESEAPIVYPVISSERIAASVAAVLASQKKEQTEKEEKAKAQEKEKEKDNPNEEPKKSSSKKKKKKVDKVDVDTPENGEKEFKSAGAEEFTSSDTVESAAMEVDQPVKTEATSKKATSAAKKESSGKKKAAKEKSKQGTKTDQKNSKQGTKTDSSNQESPSKVTTVMKAAIAQKSIRAAEKTSKEVSGQKTDAAPKSVEESASSSESDEESSYQPIVVISNKQSIQTGKKSSGAASASKKISEPASSKKAEKPSAPIPVKNISSASEAAESEKESVEKQTTSVPRPTSQVSSSRSPRRLSEKSPALSVFETQRVPSPLKITKASVEREEDTQELAFSESEDEGIPRKDEPIQAPAQDEGLDYSEPFNQTSSEDERRENIEGDRSSGTELDDEVIKSPALTSKVVDYSKFREKIDSSNSGLSKHGVTANRKNATGRAVARELFSTSPSNPIQQVASVVKSKKPAPIVARASDLSDNDSEEEVQKKASTWQQSVKATVQAEESGSETENSAQAKPAPVEKASKNVPSNSKSSQKPIVEPDDKSIDSSSDDDGDALAALAKDDAFASKNKLVKNAFKPIPSALKSFSVSTTITPAGKKTTSFSISKKKKSMT